jgi:hypothetical protein
MNDAIQKLQQMRERSLQGGLARELVLYATSTCTSLRNNRCVSLDLNLDDVIIDGEPDDRPDEVVPVLAGARQGHQARHDRQAAHGVVPGEVEVAPGGKGASKSAAKSTQSADASKGSTYTVRKGDTLYSIAQRELGNKRRWQEISALNGGNDSLSPGATIKLPARR